MGRLIQPQEVQGRGTVALARWLVGKTLVRTQAGQTDVVTDQVVGFRIGVSLWNQLTATSSEAYNFDASTYGFDYTLIRSVRLMLIGRTRPNFEASYRFRNDFDQGPYQIQPVSLVVNPRNLSLRD